ncbi:Hypothetical protein MIP_02616 [Mycobacterium intracellulare subsp. intracellulare MTCC 9506]|uniref:Uncharacterized protein n=1 Tax=Mycobacterium indicus pranii (strain DSM 45239 / MTCC 9506) TaxID=1232724 RepID=J9W9C5_MYCIP|nr:Hypothetical protein MIP_02616 [Mycobacterium intracellulare subsp. intracellulare MTCC 9506]
MALARPPGFADWRNDVFSIRLSSGEEVQASAGDELEINQETGVLSVSRVDGFEEITTHYSPSAWLSVTHRQKGAGVRPSPNWPPH